MVQGSLRLGRAAVQASSSSAQCRAARSDAGEVNAGKMRSLISWMRPRRRWDMALRKEVRRGGGAAGGGGRGRRKPRTRMLFKIAAMSEDVIKKKVFPLSLKGKALTWFRLCDDIGSWNYNRLKLEFHQKFYPMHLVHRDRNYIYNFWPREGESIAQACGRLKSMLY